MNALKDNLIVSFIVFVTFVFVFCMCKSQQLEYSTAQVFTNYTLLIQWDKPTGYSYIDNQGNPASQQSTIAPTDVLNYDIHVYQSNSETLTVDDITMKPPPGTYDMILERDNIMVAPIVPVNITDTVRYAYSQSFTNADISLKENEYLHVFIRAHIEDGRPGRYGRNETPKLISMSDMILERVPDKPAEIRVSILSEPKYMEEAPIVYEVRTAEGTVLSDYTRENSANTTFIRKNNIPGFASKFPYILDKDVARNLIIKPGKFEQVNIRGLLYDTDPDNSLTDNIFKGLATLNYDYCVFVYLGPTSTEKHKYLRISFTKASGTISYDREAIMDRLFDLVEPTTELQTTTYIDSNANANSNYMFELYYKTPAPDPETESA